MTTQYAGIKKNQTLDSTHLIFVTQKSTPSHSAYNIVVVVCSGREFLQKVGPLPPPPAPEGDSPSYPSLQFLRSGTQYTTTIPAKSQCHTMGGKWDLQSGERRDG